MTALHIELGGYILIHENELFRAN